MIPENYISYITDAKQTIDRHDIYADNPEFYLGNSEFYDYEFSPPSTTLDAELAAWIEGLRREHGYVRLWFSGGKDSRLVLDCAMRHSIKIDEVVVMMPLSCGDFVFVGSPSEIISQAYPILEKVPYPVKIIKLFNEHFDAVFSDSNWFKKTHQYYFHTAMYPSIFFRYINPRFHLLSSHGVDIMGFIEPHVWFDRGWKFQFIDKQINAVYNSIKIPAFHAPIVNCFLHSLVSNLQKSNIYPVRFDPIYRQRQIKQYSPEYNEIHLPKYSFEYEKNRQIPPDTYHGRFMIGHKDQFLLQHFQSMKTPPTSFTKWRDNTPWHEIDNEPYCKGINSREFTILTSK